MSDRVARLTAAFHAEENPERRELLFDLILRGVKLRLKHGEKTRYEVRLGRWGMVPGDGYKLIDSTPLYTLPSREEAWLRVIDMAGDHDLSQVLVKKPAHLLFNDPEADYPTPWDVPPAALEDLVRDAVRKSLERVQAELPKYAGDVR